MSTSIDLVDVVVHNVGVFLFELNTEAAREFVAEQVEVEDWQWLGDDTFAVDGRNYAIDLAEGMIADGLVLR